MLKKVFLGLISISVILTVFASFSVFADTAKPTENEMLTKVYELSIKSDYNGAVEELKRILELYPDTKNEDVYFKLCDMYNEYLFDYPKAVETYKIYLEKFPNGRFYGTYSSKLEYLEKNKSEWPVLKGFNEINKLVTEKNDIKTAIKMMENLIEKYPDTSLRFQIYSWMADQNTALKRFSAAASYMEKYYSQLPKDRELTAEEQVAIIKYAGTLTSANRYIQAMKILDTYPQKSHLDNVQYEASLSFIKKEYRIWLGFIASAIYVVIMIVLILFMKPWKIKITKSQIIVFVVSVLTIIISVMIAKFYIEYTNNGVQSIYPTMGLCGIAALILVRLLAPLINKFNKPVYFVLCFLTVLACLYFSFYFWDRLWIFWTPFGSPTYTG